MQLIDDNTLKQIGTGLIFPISLVDSIKVMQETAKKLVEAYVEPMRRVADMLQESFKRTMEAVRTVVQNIAPLLQLMLNWRPLIYVTPPTLADEGLGRHLVVGINPHGYFVFGGKTIFRLHSRTSRVGRFLHCLVLAISEVVTYEEIQERIGSGDRQKAFKDLKYKLGQEGYALDYTLVRTEGIALKGVIAIK